MARVSHSAETPMARLVDQLKVTGGGMIGAAVAVPYLMSLWVPTHIALLWGVAYVLQSLFFLGVVSFCRPGVGRLSWALVTAVLFGSVSISVLIWGQENSSAVWIAAMVTFSYASFEAVTMPHLKVDQWYLGILVAGLAMGVMAAVEVHPLVAVALVPVLVNITVVAGRNKKLQTDLDDQLHVAETMLSTDPLTGLLNRRGLEAALATAAHTETTVAIFDADRFKAINDTQGHGVGDQALQMIADRLRDTLSSRWSIARLGGDEFVAVANGAAEVDAEVMARFQMSFTDRPGKVHFSVTCGLATGIATETGDRLLSEAGHALRHAKRQGQRIVRSEGELRDRFDRSVTISTLGNIGDRIVPVVQPIVDDNGVRGCELLARWHSPDGTLLPPAQFMDMLVENGLLTRLDNVMLEYAVRLASELESAGVDAFVSANIGAGHLLDPGLIRFVRGLLKQFHLAPERLMIEITESERLGSGQGWEEAVQGLRQLGVLLAIDDFGAGYSSVARLKDLQITHLKIDRSLVIDADGPLGSIIDGVTRFCQASDIGVIAEGIETVDQHLAMRSAEVKLFQGYLFGRPMRIADFLQDLADRRDQLGIEASGASGSTNELETLNFRG